MPELSAGLPGIPDLPWESLSHRRERMRYGLDIPYIAREDSTAEILALRKAWARAAAPQ